jgi:hypothetical protein
MSTPSRGHQQVSFSGSSTRWPPTTCWSGPDLLSQRRSGLHPGRRGQCWHDVYTNAWVDILSEPAPRFHDFSAAVQTAITEEVLSATEPLMLLTPALVAFTIAGYVAADVSVTGLERVAATKTSNWENYIAALEEAPVEFPLGGPVDFTGGKRRVSTPCRCPRRIRSLAIRRPSIWSWRNRWKHLTLSWQVNRITIGLVGEGRPSPAF